MTRSTKTSSVNPPQVTCINCGFEGCTPNQVCSECGFRSAELLLWRSRNAQVWLELRDRMIRSVRRLWLFVLGAVFLSLGMSLFVSSSGGKLPQWLEMMIPRVFQVLILGGATWVAIGMDLALRELPSWRWRLKSTRLSYWLPGGAIGLVGAIAPLWFFRGGLSPVASLLQIALGALVVATATSTASTVERIARLRCATGDLNGREQLRAATAGSRSWIIWAFCMCAVLLYSWIRQWSDASSSGGLGLSSFNEVAALSSAGSCSVWIGLLLWLRQFLAAKRELVRWTNE